ncbi:MAG TPA: hypothetical protein VH416_08425 [Gaiellaceae bacterium]|jgi:hypothetical protein
MSEGPVPTPEELVAELQKTKVEDLLVHTCSLIASIGFGKLAAEPRDLEQARTAIEALRALQPLLPEEPGREVQGLVSAMQLSYAEAVAG